MADANGNPVLDDEYDGDLWDDEPCQHDHDEECYDDDDRATYCTHQHCSACGGCGCPGYCDDYQTYNLRPAETGGEPEGIPASSEERNGNG